MMGLKIIRVNGTNVTLITMLIRTLVALLGEGFVMLASFYLLQLLGIFGMPESVGIYCTYIFNDHPSFSYHHDHSSFTPNVS